MIHDIPTGVVLSNSYPMGHYYAFKDSLAEYTLLDSSTFSSGGWVSSITAVTGGNLNIKGVRLKYYISGSGSATSGGQAIVYFRPTGSSYAAITGQAVGGGFTVGFSGNTITYVKYIGEADVPVNSNLLIDYYSDLILTTTRQLLIIQLGVWI